MSYDEKTAASYSAYRPPLHALILAKCLDACTWRGLDVGCGTGNSSLALTEYCERVVGIDPSPEMLARAIPHPRVEYQGLVGENLPFPDEEFDVVTFAGSLFYIESRGFLREIISLVRPGGKVVVYDFKIFDGGAYDHRVNLDHLGLRWMNKIYTLEEETTFTVTAPQLASLLAADAVRDQYTEAGAEERVSELTATLFATVYELKE